MSKDSGIVEIHGKSYQTVALRIKNFREKYPTWRLLTQVQHRDENCVVVKATIYNENGTEWATGHAEEYRDDGQINRTSALENAETSAIGRALAALGMGGTEFASADEVARAVSGAKPGVIRPTDGAKERLTPAERKVIEDTVILVKDALKEGRDVDAFGYCEPFTTMPDNKAYLWSFLNSQERARIKKQAEVANG